MMLVHRNTCCTSSVGMPIISQMISSGSGRGDRLDEVALPVGVLLEHPVDERGGLLLHVLLDAG